MQDIPLLAVLKSPMYSFSPEELIDIRLENFFGEEKFTLNDPSIGLYVGPDNWREMSNFSDDAVLLVLASEKYDEDDYIKIM